MGTITLITGGARSGKSRLAESLARESKRHVVYIATSLPIDEEMKERIRLHREQRPESWDLLEQYRGFNLGIQDDEAAILLDCITIMVTNIIFDEVRDWSIFETIGEKSLELSEKLELVVQKELENLIEGMKRRNGPSFIVTNETGMGLVPDTPVNRIFRDVLGRANQYLASEADQVSLCISGIEMKIKG